MIQCLCVWFAVVHSACVLCFDCVVLFILCRYGIPGVVLFSIVVTVVLLVIPRGSGGSAEVCVCVCVCVCACGCVCVFVCVHHTL